MGPYNKPNPVIISKGTPESVLEDIIVTHWNDLDLVENIVKKNKNDIAAILTEPMMTNAHIIEPKGYLEGLRKIASDNDILLIFDEIVSGFRVGLRGGQGLFGVAPDISIFGKALGGGSPVSAFGANKEIMSVIGKSGAIQLGTFNTNPLGLASANAFLSEAKRNGGSIYKHMDLIGDKLRKGITSIFEKIGLEREYKVRNHCLQYC